MALVFCVRRILKACGSQQIVVRVAAAPPTRLTMKESMYAPCRGRTDASFNALNLRFATGLASFYDGFLNVRPIRKAVEPDGAAGAPRAAGGFARVFLALRASGQMALRRALRHRAVPGTVRCPPALVHRPYCHLGQHPESRAVSGRRLAYSLRRRDPAADRAARRGIRALSRHQPGDLRPLHQPHPLAVALARGAAELVLLPE